MCSNYSSGETRWINLQPAREGSGPFLFVYAVLKLKRKSNYQRSRAVGLVLCKTCVCSYREGDDGERTNDAVGPAGEGGVARIGAAVHRAEKSLPECNGGCVGAESGGDSKSECAGRR